VDGNPQAGWQSLQDELARRLSDGDSVAKEALP
jgi:hypothetical protein